MPNYRRDYSGCAWFFTVVTRGRKPLFRAPAARLCLSRAIGECRHRFPFHIDAWVPLPDHMHAVWTLPDEERNYSRRWSVIKRRFTQMFRGDGAHGAPYWQARFWAHRIDDETDYRHHVDYVHINPLKHGLADSVVTWPWSTFHRYVAAGTYRPDWGGGIIVPPGVGAE